MRTPELEGKSISMTVTKPLCDVYLTDALMQCHCALLMTMIFSTGETVPFTVYGESCCFHHVIFLPFFLF